MNLGRQICLIIDNLIEELTLTIEELTPTYFDNEVVMGETRALIGGGELNIHISLSCPNNFFCNKLKNNF